MYNQQFCRSDYIWQHLENLIATWMVLNSACMDWRSYTAKLQKKVVFEDAGCWTG